MIRCPYCLQSDEPKSTKNNNTEVYTCTKCRSLLPRDFVEENYPKMTVGIIGFTGHGKTVYLTSLFYLLKFIRRSSLWENFNWQTLDENTHKIVFEHVSLFEKEHKLPKSTPANFPLPAIIEFFDMPLIGNCFFTFYDTAGAVYEEINSITNMGKFVAYADVVFFILSIPDCKRRKGRSWQDEMERFLDIYVNAVYNRLGISLEKFQHLIVVLTKADLFIDGEEEPELKEFLLQGSYNWWGLKKTRNGEFRKKINEIAKFSEFIEDWLEEKGGGGFINLARRRFKSVKYTLISAIGSAPKGKKLVSLSPEDPKRVIDPLMLIIQKIFEGEGEEERVVSDTVKELTTSEQVTQPIPDNEILQSIYTKVPKRKSYFRKGDFHTVFYPTKFLNRNDISEIEKRIHFPGDIFDEKITLFFQEIQKKWCLVILKIKNLPNEKDSLNRGGLFLCHAFIFPENIWKRTGDLLSLVKFTEGFSFTKIKDIFNSPFFDRRNGNSNNIKILPEKLGEISNTLPKLSNFNSDFVWKIIILMNRIAREKNNNIPVILKGNPENITDFLNKIFAYIPDDFKVLIGFDSCFDNGNLASYPLKIVGYKTTLPTNTSSIIIDLEKSILKVPDGIEELCNSRSCFEIWLNSLREKIKYKEEIEKAYKLSEIIEEGKDYSDKEILTGEDQKIFVSINKERIIERFYSYLKGLIWEEVVKVVIKEISIDKMFEIFFDRGKIKDICGNIVGVIIREKIPIIPGRSYIKEELLSEGNNIIRAMWKLAKGEKLSNKDIECLKEDERREFLRYLVLTEEEKEDWLLDILRTNRDVLEQLLKDNKIKDTLKPIIEEILLQNKHLFKKTFDILEEAIFSINNEYFVLEYQHLQSHEIFVNVFISLLKSKKKDEKTVEDIYKWVKKNSPDRIEETSEIIKEYQNIDPYDFKFIGKLKRFLRKIWSKKGM